MPQIQSLIPPESAYVAVSSARIKMQGGGKQMQGGERKIPQDVMSEIIKVGVIVFPQVYSPGRGLLFSRKMATAIQGHYPTQGFRQLLPHISH